MRLRIDRRQPRPCRPNRAQIRAGQIAERIGEDSRVVDVVVFRQRRKGKLKAGAGRETGPNGVVGIVRGGVEGCLILRDRVGGGRSRAGQIGHEVQALGGHVVPPLAVELDGG